MSAQLQNGLVAFETDETIFYTYKRVSSDDQEKDGMSLPVQDDETLGYGVKQPRWIFGGTFQDVETGANPSRRDYQRLLATVRADRARKRRVAIVVVKQSRFGRDIEELARAWKDLVKRLGVEIHSTRDGGHIKDELTFHFRGVMNHNELTVISEGVRNSFARARRAGWLKPGRRPWGYAWIPATDEQRRSGAPTVVAVPHETEADYVRELFRKRADGLSTYELAAWAQALPAAATGGRVLNQSTIRYLLAAPVYVARNPGADGDVLDEPPGRWQPLCDDTTWRTIHPRSGEREDPVPISTRGQYALTRFIFCEVCGSRMNGHTRQPYVRIRRGRPVCEPAYRTYMCASRTSADTLSRPDGRTCHRKIGAAAIERQLFD
jgi:DNA invertase Pin-like site-specific DNA recombinase